MMKVKVKKEFVDKHTWKLHPVGEVFECTEDRLKEIQSASPNYVERVEDPVKEPVKTRSRKKVSE